MPQTDKVIEIIELLLDNLLQKLRNLLRMVRNSLRMVELRCKFLQHIGLELNLQRWYDTRGHPQKDI